MSSFVVLGVDTDVGKTTFSALWLAAFAEAFAYWKPVETGPSDSRRLRALVPAAQVFPPVVSLSEPVAPPLAARRASVSLPSVDEVAARRPYPADSCFLLVETFGSPWSPYNEHHLQLALLHRLDLPCVLVGSTRLGAVGRTLQCLIALAAEGITPRAVVLLGDEDPFASEQIARHQSIPVISLRPPHEWSPAGFEEAARAQRHRLQEIRHHLDFAAETSPPSGNWLQRDRQAVWHPYTSWKANDPLVCVGAQAEFLHLADGRRLIDAISSWWTILWGHRDPELTRVLRQATLTIDHVLFAGVTHPWGIELAELLLASACMLGGRAFYSDNGSTAVEVALKMAYHYWNLLGQPERTRFIGFEHGYHGDTFGAMAVSRDPVFFARFEPLLFQADILPLDAAALDAHLSTQQIKPAAVIVEPLVQGAGGMRMHAPRTLADLYEVTRKHDVLFIADEVMTGGGRTGSLWAFEQAGVQPDLVCAAKTLAGGMMPLAATLASARVVAPFLAAGPKDTFFHGHSFTGHPLACAVAVANWQRLRERFASASNPALECQAFWEEALGLLRGRKGVRDVRIRGSIAAVELDAEAGYLSAAGRGVVEAASRAGVFLRPLGNVIYAMPPYSTSRESLKRIAEVMRSV